VIENQVVIELQEVTDHQEIEHQDHQVIENQVVIELQGAIDHLVTEVEKEINSLFYPTNTYFNPQ
jgi:hypothetical protein